MNFKDFIKTVDDDSNKKGDQFEKFCKWFLENDPVWKPQIKKVWLWNDWPDRWGADLGIDLVFEHINGEIWAVQSKCYGEDNPVTKKDMNSFLSESNRPQIQQRLLMASTDVIGANARSVCKNQEKKVTFQLLSDFIDSKLDYPEHINKLSKAKLLPKPKPREHQAESIKNVSKGFKKADRGQLIMACGTGKTFTTLWIKEKLKAETTLILLPSLSLLSQTLKEWSYAANQPFKSLAVCSDDSVTKGAEEDSAQNSTQDLSFPVSSDPKVIAKFLKQEGCKVIFSTYQSSPMIAEAMKSKTVPILDLVICDEAHRCAGKVGSTFTTVLDDKKIRTKQKLFTTATPRTYSTNVKKAAQDQEIIVTGMDDEEVFGSVFHKLSFGQAIEKQLLTDYQVVIVGVDEPMIKEWIDKRKILELNKDVGIDAGSLAAQVGILKAIKDYDLKRLISFHSRVERAQHFSQDILSILPIVEKKDLPKGILKTDFVSGQMTTNKRRQKLEQLKYLNDCDRQILSNARCLSEGVDVPALEGIAIIDPRKSQVDIVQTVGRAIRLSEDKSVGTIVIPVFIQNSDDPELALENSNFKPVYDVLNALKSHDEQLSFELDEMRTEMGRRKTSTGPSRNISKVTIDLPKRHTLNFAKSITTKLVEKSTESWNFWYGLLEDYIIEHNSSLVPLRYKTLEGFKLGSWVTDNRKLKNKGQLSVDRIARLDALGFVWDPLQEQWNQGFEAFKDYIAEHNSVLVPKGYKTSEGFNLGSWVNIRKNDKRIGRLTKERIAQLDALGFVWDPFQEQWNQGIDAFKKYITEHNSVLVPARYKTSEGFNLGSWVNVRKNDKRIGRLTKERITQLDALGFVWSKLDDQWNQGFEALKKYIAEHNSVSVPSGYKTADNLNLGNWVISQRIEKKMWRLSEERIAQLDALGFVWSKLDDQWNQGFEALKKYIAEHNSVSVPWEYKTADNFNLGGWLGHQRKYKKKRTLTKERIAQLDALGFVWDPFQEQWNQGIEALKKYIAEHNSVSVPWEYKTANNFNLGGWFGHQRKYKKKGILTKERIAQLDALGFVWDPFQEQWDRGIEVLKKYIAEHNSVLVPRGYKTSEGFNLSSWVNVRKNDKKKGTLTKERIAQLDALGFVWDALENQWNQGFEAFKDYIAEYNSVLVPSGYKTADNFNLGNWFGHQRKYKKKGTLTKERIAQLDALGFVWDPYQEKWNQGFEAFKDYIAEHNSVLVPKGYKTSEGFNLGGWVANKRSEKKKGTLTKERIAQLDALGFIWK